MIRSLIIGFTLVSSVQLHAEEPQHTCLSTEGEETWIKAFREVEGQPEELADVRAMYRLRQKLCSDLIDGKITYEEAYERFESERDAWGKRIDERRKKSQGQVGSGQG